MCDNKRARVFNLLMATILIQHVAHVVQAAAEATLPSQSWPPQQWRQDDNGRGLSSSPAMVKRDTSDTAAAARMTSGEAPLDSEVDYAVYMNDFNMQDETTIPEDILDQQHIKDGGESDVIEADPQYDSSAAGDGDQEVADIILESHRSAESSNSSSLLPSEMLNGNLEEYKNENSKKQQEEDINNHNNDGNQKNEINVGSTLDPYGGNPRSFANNNNNYLKNYPNNNSNKGKNNNNHYIAKIKNNDMLRMGRHLQDRSASEAIDGPPLQGNNDIPTAALSSAGTKQQLNHMHLLVGEKFNKVSTNNRNDGLDDEEQSSKDVASIEIKSKATSRSDDMATVDDARDFGTRSAEGGGAIGDIEDVPPKPNISNGRSRDGDLNTVASDGDGGKGVDFASSQMELHKFGAIRYSGNGTAVAAHNQSGLRENEPQQTAPWMTGNLNAASQTTGPQSAFELFKAQRRNSPHNGHKSHKKKYKDYLHYVEAAKNRTPSTSKLATDNTHRLPASPFFAVPKRPATSKPFYEGQVNYFLETKDDDDEMDSSASSSGRNQIKDTSRNWYSRAVPVLRNGIKSSKVHENHESSGVHHSHHSHGHHNRHYQIHQQKPQDTHLNHRERRLGHHSSHHQHHHQHQHHRQSSGNPYQRKAVSASANPKPDHSLPLSHYDSKVLAQQPVVLKASTESPTRLEVAPEQPNLGRDSELGHQITEMEQLERYYLKWPHLARVQFQVYDEHFRETHPELYAAQLSADPTHREQGNADEDYDSEAAEYAEYESTAELEEAQRGGNDPEANLPPYIKKYNRRNKQLLNLLEGTIAPPTLPPQYSKWSKSMLQPGPHESSAMAGSQPQIRLDDDYMKEKRRRYHMRYGYNNNNENFKHLQEDLFAQQREERQKAETIGQATGTPAPMATTTTTTFRPSASQTIEHDGNNNNLPDEDTSIKEDNSADGYEDNEESAGGRQGSDLWPRKLRTNQMAWQIGKLITTKAPGSMATSTQKAAIFKLPSYPSGGDVAGNFAGVARTRNASPSSSASMGLANSLSRFNGGEKNVLVRSTADPTASVSPHPGARPPINGRSINSFVYHRVVDTSPRLVGTGSSGHKQRLPFVAITDRRLEMSKKALLERQKELDQNHFPMP